MELQIETIVKDFDRMIAGLICKKTGHQDHCHDIHQEVYIRMMQKMDKIKNADNLKSYLFRMADNAVTDYYRKKTNKSFELRPEELEEPDLSYIQEPEIRLADCCLRPMIESMEPVYRDALIMTELEGLSQKQYAEKVGISVANAKIRVFRAKDKLKKIIMDCCQYEFDRYGNIVGEVAQPPKSCCN